VRHKIPRAKLAAGKETGRLLRNGAPLIKIENSGMNRLHENAQQKGEMAVVELQIQTESLSLGENSC
jgi:uncharacterized protein YbjQ (UPF0145 family)